ncbi:MAG: hypothetical protein JXX14_12605 [Deltaproteobacteria bacterium]|nr:hypothetical protein [Deltaproteobacteria bacterium]
MRDAIVREALQLYRSGKSAEHYGDGDVADVFNKAGYPGCWQTNDDVPKMVKKAVQLKAYRTKEKPEPGDLLLFHNQTDRNRNGKSDDWFTGVAIVVETGRHTHLAVTRTGGQPIKIFISPNGPMVRTYKGTTVNSFVRLPGPHDPLDAQYLSGQLYAGFIDSEVIVSRRDVK